jgi:hypothetical protein
MSPASVGNPSAIEHSQGHRDTNNCGSGDPEQDGSSAAGRRAV